MASRSAGLLEVLSQQAHEVLRTLRAEPRQVIVDDLAPEDVFPPRSPPGPLPAPPGSHLSDRFVDNLIVPLGSANSSQRELKVFLAFKPALADEICPHLSLRPDCPTYLLVFFDLGCDVVENEDAEGGMLA